MKQLDEVKALFLNSLPTNITIEEAVEMNLLKEETMRNFLIVNDIFKRLESRDASFYNILFELESKYELSVRQLARIYNKNRHFLKRTERKQRN
ncbi:MAG: hypothetical protein IPL35_13670 [Sphingobacteriales bacterium]|nr:hypothetical protein [Sphingobacteriales bacterium]